MSVCALQYWGEPNYHTDVLFFLSSLLVSVFSFPASSLLKGPLRMAQSLPRTTRPPLSISYTTSSAHIYTQTRMQPLVSQMESMWMSINRVEKGREWAAGGEEGGGAAAGATDQNHGQLPPKRRELFSCLTKSVSIHTHIHNAYTCAISPAQQFSNHLLLSSSVPTSCMSPNGFPRPIFFFPISPPLFTLLLFLSSPLYRV